MAGKRYSAGRIFLQVVPSFDNLQRDIGREVGRANAGLERDAAESGRRSGEARGKAESKALVTARQRTDEQQMAHDDKMYDKVLARRAARERDWTQKLVDGHVKSSRDEEAKLAKINDGALAWKMNAEQRAAAARLKNEQGHANGLDRIAQNTFNADLKRLQDRTAAEQGHADALDRIARNSLNNRIREIRSEADAAKKARDQIDADHGRGLAEQIRRETKANAERQRLQGGHYGQDLHRATSAAAAAIPDQTAGVDTSEAERRLAALRARLLALSDAKIGIDIDAEAAELELKKIRIELSRLDGRNVNIDVKVNAARALAEIKGIEMAGKGGGGRSMFSFLNRDAQDGANAFRIFNFRILGVMLLLPMLAPLLATAAGGFAALATAAVGVLAGLGVAALGFSGMIGALQAMNAMQDSGAKHSAAAAKKAATDARTMRDALQGLDQAKLASARASVDSNRAIADAEKKLADTQKNATATQEALRAARKAAQQDQIDLADKIKAGILDERQALIDLFDAQVAYNSAIQDGAATNKEKEQASINLARAQLSIKGIRGNNVKLAGDAVASKAAGIEGAPGVITAKDNAANALQAQKDAIQGVADARAAADRSRIDNLRSIRDANERVSDAQLQASEGLGAEASAVDALALAMSKLSPAGRVFATWLFSLKPHFKDLRDTVQTAMLPGVQEGLQTIIDKYGPAFLRFVGVMGKVVGEFFVAMGNAMTSPAMAEFFATMAKYAPDFFKLFGDISLNIMQVFAGIMVAFAPYAKDFMTALADASKGWATWAAGLKDSPQFAEFMKFLKAEGPKVWQLLKDISTTILHMLEGMKDNGTFDVIMAFFDWLANLDPKTIGNVMSIILGMALLSQVLSGLSVLITTVGAVFTIFGITGGLVAGLIVIAVLAVIAALVWMYFKFDWFRNAVNVVFSFLWNDIFKPILGLMGDYWKTIWQGMVWAWDHILHPLFDAIGKVVTDFPSVWETALKQIGIFWNGLLDLVGRPVNFVIGIINDGIIDNFNKIAGFFTGDPVTISRIKPVVWGESVASANHVTNPAAKQTKGQRFSEGGWTGEGSKYQPAGLVHADEYVVRKSSQRKMRAMFPGLLDHINETGSLDGYGFASGGLVGFGHLLQKMGYQVSEQSQFGGVSAGAHAKNSWHYRDGAIDVNHDGAGQGAETAAINKIVGMARDYGLRTIWQVADHFNHAHFDIGGGADMGGGSSLPAWIQKPVDYMRSAVDSLMSKIPFKGKGIDVFKAVPGKLIDSAVGYIANLVSGNNGGSGDSAIAPDAGMGQWNSTVLAALEYLHLPANLLGTVIARMKMESSGNAKAINLTDSNALRGTPSKGLMQVIDPTFARWRDKSLPNDIWNPMANIVASMNYAQGVYGSLPKAYNRIGGYAEGGLVDNGTMMYDSGGMLPPGMTTVLNMTGQPEPVFTAEQMSAGALGGKGPLVGSLTIPLMGTNLTPADVSEELLYTLRRIDNGGVYAGRTN